MNLEGSCHCGAVSFGVRSAHPYPFNLCYCSICRKTAGGGGYAINLGADYSTLQVRGEENIAVYCARLPDRATGAPKDSPVQRSFCRICGSALWAWDPRWPELVHPFASPRPSIQTCLHLLSARISWRPLRHRGFSFERRKTTRSLMATRTSPLPIGTDVSVWIVGIPNVMRQRYADVHAKIISKARRSGSAK